MNAFGKMKALRVPAIVAMIIPCINAYAADPLDSIVCHIEGTVIDRPDSKVAFLMEAGSDFRVQRPIELKITDGKFSYDLTVDLPREYEIIFDDELSRGSWYNKQFFVGDGDVTLTYYDSERNDSNRVVSSLPDNIIAERWKKMRNDIFRSSFKELEDSVDSLYESGRAYSEPLRQLLGRYEAAKEDTAEKDSLREAVNKFFADKDDSRKYSPEMLALRNQQFELYRQMDSLQMEMISREPSLYGLSTIKTALLYNKEFTERSSYEDLFNRVYREAMSAHPYAAEIIMMIDADAVRKGEKYPDYTVTRPDGSTARIADLIKGKIAVINMWASWCGPCRKHSKALIPTYQQYRDKNFALIAIARESDNCDAMNEAMKKDGYPWESFVDINDHDNVWKINGVGNAGGRIVLLDADGVIVDADTTPEIIDAYLKENL